VSASAPEWLVVVDAQRAFAEPTSPWRTPGFDAIANSIERLIRHFDGRVAFTRFVPPERPSGSWADYYDRWAFARAPGAQRLWELVEPWRGRPTVDLPTLSKWGPPLRAAVGGSDRIAICGVSTDCCVLATALGAADDGAHVRVVHDACAAQPELHRAALEILRARSPLVTLATVDELAAREPAS
jgi:nicotinamidase-related amidase